ncbi:MAG: DUF502 domain-containing protein [Vicingaceae bacterium]
MKAFWRKIFSYFLQGLVLIMPVAAIIWIIVWLFLKIDGIIPDSVKEAYHLGTGIGAILVFIIITLLGFLGGTFIAQPIKDYFVSLINKVPLLKTIYTSVKDLMNAFVGKEKKFKHPVLVRLSKDSNLQKLGFITSKDLSTLGLDNNKIAVYLPHSYAFSGNLFIVDKENVTSLDIPSSSVMKFIVSGGVADLSEEQENE